MGMLHNVVGGGVLTGSVGGGGYRVGNKRENAYLESRLGSVALVFKECALLGGCGPTGWVKMERG
jgi:hypothetical protein